MFLFADNVTLLYRIYRIANLSWQCDEGRVKPIESPICSQKFINIPLKLITYAFTSYNLLRQFIPNIDHSILPKLNFRTYFFATFFVQFHGVTPFRLVNGVHSSSPSFPVNILNTSAYLIS